MLLVAGLALFAITVSHSAPTSPTPGKASPTRRCAPPQWESTVYGKVSQIIDGRPTVYSVLANSSSDFTNKRTAFHEVMRMENGTEIRASVVSDYKQKVVHFFYPDIMKCLTSKLADKMKEFCDDNTKKLSSFMVGGKMADMYEIEQSYFNFTARSSVTVFRDTFELISAVTENIYMQTVPQMLAFQYGNYTTGINEERAFMVPDYCAN